MAHFFLFFTSTIAQTFINYFLYLSIKLTVYGKHDGEKEKFNYIYILYSCLLYTS